MALEAARRSGQQPEPVIESVSWSSATVMDCIRDAASSMARRNAIQATADFSHRVCVIGLVERHCWRHCLRALDE